MAKADNCSPGYGVSGEGEMYTGLWYILMVKMGNCSPSYGVSVELVSTVAQAMVYLMVKMGNCGPSYGVSV